MSDSTSRYTIPLSADEIKNRLLHHKLQTAVRPENNKIIAQVDYVIKEGSELKFKAPVDSSKVECLEIKDSDNITKSFYFSDANGISLKNHSSLFAANAIVKVILGNPSDAEPKAFVQNADTNAYLEKRFDSITGDSTNSIQGLSDNITNLSDRVEIVETKVDTESTMSQAISAAIKVAEDSLNETIQDGLAGITTNIGTIAEGKTVVEMIEAARDIAMKDTDDKIRELAEGAVATNTTNIVDLQMAVGTTAGGQEVATGLYGIIDSKATELQGQIDSLANLKPKAGFIYPLASETVPEGFLLCDGTEYLKDQYPELEAAIGTTYGGVPDESFCVPNLQTRVPVGADGDNYALGQTGGDEKVTLDIDKIPSHEHWVEVDSTGVYRVGWSATLDTTSGGTNAGYITTNINSGYITTANTGGSQPHNNMQPYTVVNYIIATGEDTGVSVDDIYEEAQKTFNPIIEGAQAIPLSVGLGGTGATSVTQARLNLGIPPLSGFESYFSTDSETELNDKIEMLAAAQPMGTIKNYEMYFSTPRVEVDGTTTSPTIPYGSWSVTIFKPYGPDYVSVSATVISNDFGILRLHRKLLEGVWQEWEYVNPPLKYNVPYRTTERWNGEVVYQILVEFGYLPNNGHKLVYSNINGFKEICDMQYMLTNWGQGIYDKGMDNYSVYMVNPGTIHIATTTDMTGFKADILVRYIKG